MGKSIQKSASGQLVDEDGTPIDLSSLIVASGTFTQTYSTSTTTVPVIEAAAVATTGATNSSPYGFTAAAQADAIVAAVNNLVLAVTTNRKLINAIIDSLQAGEITG